MQNLATKDPKLYDKWKLTGLSIYEYLQTHGVYISTYPCTHHKNGMFYAAVVQCFSQVYYSYYKWQSDDTYKWENKIIHHNEFERTEKELSSATYEQALERAIDIAFDIF